MAIKLTSEQISALRAAYEDNLKGKNWGLWNIESMPDVGISYTVNQYEDPRSDKKPAYDIIKFDKEVNINGEIGKKFIMSGQRVGAFNPIDDIDGKL